MDRPIVSIIIPVYNLKDYVEKAYDSICSQTLTNWEMFLVDDGSTDGTSEICDILASDDSRIHVIHQENQGAAGARNAAIENATGKYLYFLDADDWAVSDMLYDMVCLAENYYLDAWAGVPVNNAGRQMEAIGRFTQSPADMIADVPEEQCAQMVITGFYIETYYSETDYYIQKQSVPSRVFADKTEFREYAHELFDRNLLYTPWNKLYLTSYIRENQIRFPKTHWDDFPFNLEVIRNIERVTVSDKAYYHFLRKRSDSESEKYNIGLYEKREEENQWLLDLYAGWKEQLQERLLAELERHKEELPEIVKPEEIEEKKSAVDPNEGDPVEGDLSGGDSTEGDSAKENSAEETAAENVLAAIMPQVQFPSPQDNEFISRRYLERLVGCIENVTNPECPLSHKEKIQDIKQMITKDSVKEALKVAKPKSSYMKAMLVPIRMRSAGLAYLEGKMISRVKKKNIKMFAKLKAGR